MKRTKKNDAWKERRKKSIGKTSFEVAVPCVHTAGTLLKLVRDKGRNNRGGGAASMSKGVSRLRRI